MESETKESYIDFAAIGGSFVDFKNIDLTPWRIQGGLVESSETEKFIRPMLRFK
jgi:hypothetical protein